MLSPLDTDIRTKFLSQQDFIDWYILPEMWICSKTKKSISLWNSNIDHYKQEYKPYKYIK